MGTRSSTGSLPTARDTEAGSLTAMIEASFKRLQQSRNRHVSRRTEGQKHENKSKNRTNVVPFDSTRVVLHDGDPDIPGCDYINASHISVDVTSGAKSKRTKRYIATQGCLPSTVADFWRMVVQQRCPVIVMLANEVEHGKKKVAQYWPSLQEDSNLQLNVYSGRIVIRLKKETKRPGYITQELEASVTDHSGTVSYQQMVHQFHFTSWSDFAVPENPESVLEFIKRVNTTVDGIQNAGPLLVHCSAGIGRTGTFIVADAMLQQLESKGGATVKDVERLVQTVRSQRAGLIQNEGQYSFVFTLMRLYEERIKRRH